MDPELEAEVTRILGGGNTDSPLASLYAHMQEKVEAAERAWHSRHTTHGVVDWYLVKALLVIAEDHPEGDVIRAMVKLWQSYGKVRSEDN